MQKGSGVADTDIGPISSEAVRRLACDATVSRMVLGGDSAPVEVSSRRRLVSPPLRRALDLQDQGCTHPGCEVPARWCDAHHIRHWADGGKTNLANLRLLCRKHHRDAHDHQPYPRRQ
jgi:5-methylcytosine-specific restriction endonuclease McrA